MTCVEEIEKAIEQLSSEDFSRLSRWMQERNQAVWDQQLDADSKSGKLDWLFNEANSTNLKEFPPAE